MAPECTLCWRLSLRAPRSPWRFGDLLADVQPLEGLWSHATIVTDRGRLRRALRWVIEDGDVRRTTGGYRLTRGGARSIAAGRHNLRVSRDEAARRRAERLSSDAAYAQLRAEADRIWMARRASTATTGRSTSKRSARAR